MRRLQRRHRLAILFDSNRVLASQLCLPVDDGDLVLFKQKADAGRELLGDPARTLHDLVEIEADIVGRKAELIEMGEKMGNLGATQQGLGRDAAPS